MASKFEVPGYYYVGTLKKEAEEYMIEIDGITTTLKPVEGQEDRWAGTWSRSWIEREYCSDGTIYEEEIQISLRWFLIEYEEYLLLVLDAEHLVVFRDIGSGWTHVVSLPNVRPHRGGQGYVEISIPQVGLQKLEFYLESKYFQVERIEVLDIDISI